MTEADTELLFDFFRKAAKKAGFEFDDPYERWRGGRERYEDCDRYFLELLPLGDARQQEIAKWGLRLEPALWLTIPKEYEEWIAGFDPEGPDLEEYRNDEKLRFYAADGKIPRNCAVIGMTLHDPIQKCATCEFMVHIEKGKPVVTTSECKYQMNWPAALREAYYELIRSTIKGYEALLVGA